jgi:hypothetical protein
LWWLFYLLRKNEKIIEKSLKSYKYSTDIKDVSRRIIFCGRITPLRQILGCSKEEVFQTNQNQK